MERRVIIIAGPTASGKSEFAFCLAQRLNTEIISADSRQIYRSLNIGTAKPPQEMLSRIRHHLIDEIGLDQKYSAGQFEKDALKIIEALHARNKIPLVVGGTGLYIKALVDGIIDIEPDDIIRDELHNLREERGNDYLYHRLLEADPLAAETMRPTNWKRVLRALEIKLSTGESILDFHRAHQRNCDIQFQQFGIAPDRKTLYARIDQRVDQMMLQGLIEETKKISAMGFSASDNALNTVGYKEALSYLQNEIPLDEAVRLIKRNTRHYAKRQMTRFNKDRRIHWIRFQI